MKMGKYMKKLIFVLLAIIVIFAVTSCDFFDEGKGGEEIYILGSTRNFWAQNVVSQTFYEIEAEKLAENSRCVVWAEKGSGVTTATANSVANAYNTVYTKMMNTFGYQVIDPSLGRVNTMEIAHYLITRKTSGAKLTILLLDIKDGYKTENDPYVGGYFYAYDLYKNDPKYPQKSNELDMIYLDTYPSILGSTSSNETLAHEMQHLMNFVSTCLWRDSEMDTWINEGLSTAAEWVYSGVHSEGRWKYYNLDPSKLINKGNNFYIWDNHKDNPYANLDDYATAYLFFQWLRLQSDNPNLQTNKPNVYREIGYSDFSDYKAVTDVAKTKIDSGYNDWSLLLRDWHAANFTNASSGLYGYKNDPILKDVKAPMVPQGITTVSLFPGEGVYSKTSSAGSLPSAGINIRYAGLSRNGAPSNTTGFADGARLTYNVNTNMDGASESGSTTGIAPSVGFSISGGSASVQILSNKFTYPFKVDAGYFHNGNINNNIPDIKIGSVFNESNSRNIDKNNNILKVDRSTIERVFIDE
jgi:hypothetical protein